MNNSKMSTNINEQFKGNLYQKFSPFGYRNIEATTRGQNIYWYAESTVFFLFVSFSLLRACLFFSFSIYLFLRLCVCVYTYKYKYVCVCSQFAHTHFISVFHLHLSNVQYYTLNTKLILQNFIVICHEYINDKCMIRNLRTMFLICRFVNRMEWCCSLFFFQTDF